MVCSHSSTGHILTPPGLREKRESPTTMPRQKTGTHYQEQTTQITYCLQPPVWRKKQQQLWAWFTHFKNSMYPISYAPEVLNKNFTPKVYFWNPSPFLRLVSSKHPENAMLFCVICYTAPHHLRCQLLFGSCSWPLTTCHLLPPSLLAPGICRFPGGCRV